MLLNNLFNNIFRKQDNKYYKKSGEIHVSEIGNLAWYYSAFSSKVEKEHKELEKEQDKTKYGEKFCDCIAASRNHSWVRIGELVSKLDSDQKLFLLGHYILE